MHLGLLALAFQLGFAALPARPAQGRVVTSAADSVRDLKRARAAQASFEFTRRYNLPERGGSAGRCDVHLGRFCWWYDEEPTALPPEAKTVVRRRATLIAMFDSLGAIHPGDDWLAGMRVHYRVDGGDAAAADSVARSCRATAWWCLALIGYADHVLGQTAAAESAFVQSLATMPSDERCRWRDISTLLPDRTRGRYEKLGCDARAPIEERYWMLSRPQLDRPTNEWRTEFYVRRVQSRIAEKAVTPQPSSWGQDAAELVLRYGWPSGWSRTERPAGLVGEPGIVGHDPVPSFAFAPSIDMLDTLAAANDDAWKLHEHLAESRFAPRLVRRVAPVVMQTARFQRGDSTLLVAAYAVTDDSLNASAPVALGATMADGRTLSAPSRSSARFASLTLPAVPVLAGVEIADTVTRTLVRARVLFAPAVKPTGLALSDLLLYRSHELPPASLDSALAHAIAGDIISRSRPLGIYWETYGAPDSASSVDVAVTVERIDRSWLRGAKQRMRLAAPDSPLRLLWSDARPSRRDGPAARTISLDLGNLEPGRYRVTVATNRTDDKEQSASSSREIDLRER
jgi:hypothetical protein